jgi:hypothetical protein
MIDWMLLHSGLGSEAKAADFVKRYNASVFYDKNLELKEMAATRQSNLLDPAKISADRKALLRRRVNSCDSFTASGLSVYIMNAVEFWAGSRLHSSTHPLWKDLGSTTEESCTVACLEYFDRCDKGQSGLSLFKEISKRAMLCDSLVKGSYARLKIKDSVMSGMVGKIMNGKYDADIGAMLGDAEELDEHNLRSFDMHLVEYYTVCADAVELNNLSPAAGMDNDASQVVATSTGAGAGMSDAAWTLRELEHSLGRFEKCSNEYVAKKEELKKKEAEFSQAGRTNAASATQSFLDKFVKMVPYCGDTEKFNKELNAVVDTRRMEISQHEGCDPGAVLVTSFVDRQ